jgi:nitroimidazol reductase NimA-like FMN-containing flavoprotein (pyridoxamine 5'-phosphate oxidase superfamily)
MDKNLHDTVIAILNSHRLMTLATSRSDGWAQATTVSYVNDGLSIYCFVARFGKKFANIQHDERVSVAIAGDFSDPMEIKGLSLAGRASVVADKQEFDKMCAAFLKRFPEYGNWPRPSPTFSPLLRIAPQFISIVDYSKGFGHTDTVELSQLESPRMETRRQSWFSQLLG